MTTLVKCLLFFLCVSVVGFVLLQNWIVLKQDEKSYLPSVSQSPETNIDDNMLILYNRIPKTGSTSFMSVLYDLCTINKFSVAYVNVSSSSHRFQFVDQYTFARNITVWHQRKPAIYSGHFPFLDFTKLGLAQPLYINILRRPLDRVVSHYYFVRYGDTFLPKKVRSRQGDKTTFDDCVEKRDRDCRVDKLWLQIPYFCGSEPFCWEFGNEKALERAKYNLQHRYFLVGVMEQMDGFVQILEKTIPRFFHGAHERMNREGGVHIRKTKVKKPLLQKTIDYFESTKIWKMENEFYQFAKSNFDAIYKQFKVAKIHISYNKVRP